MADRVFARGSDGRCSVSDAKPDPGPSPSGSGLTASVGEGGNNVPADVKNVQERLNRIPSASGGPWQPLKVDGICGTNTKYAIKRFQQAYWTELLGDGRVDPGKATWNKLVAMSATTAVKSGGAVTAPIPGQLDDPAIQELWAQYLWLSQYRVYEAIKCLDVARSEVDFVVQTAQAQAKSIQDTFVMQVPGLKELPTVNRCFKIMFGHVTQASLYDKIGRIRKVFNDMLSVIVQNSIKTQSQIDDHSHDFLMIVQQAVLDTAHPDHPPNDIIADARLGGWWNGDANIGRIRYGSNKLERTDGISTLIHEMAHYVSHSTTYTIEDAGGYYRAAFSAGPELCVRNAENYSWYANLASFKHLRPLPNNVLPTDI